MKKHHPFKKKKMKSKNYLKNKPGNTHQKNIQLLLNMIEPSIESFHTNQLWAQLKSSLQVAFKDLT